MSVFGKWWCTCDCTYTPVIWKRVFAFVFQVRSYSCLVEVWERWGSYIDYGEAHAEAACFHLLLWSTPILPSLQDLLEGADRLGKCTGMGSTWERKIIASLLLLFRSFVFPPPPPRCISLRRCFLANGTEIASATPRVKQVPVDAAWFD